MIILVQSSSLYHYPQLRETQEQTWANKDVKTPIYFFQGGNPVNKVVGNTLYVKSGTNYHYMFITAAKAFEMALKFQWNYLVKTDNSAYVNIPVMKEFLKHKPTENFVCGKQVGYIPNRMDFLWGECMIFSRDVVETLVQRVASDPYPKYGMDDVHISDYLSDIKWDTTLQIGITKEDKTKKFPVYRFKDEDYRDDIKGMIELHRNLQ